MISFFFFQFFVCFALSVFDDVEVDVDNDDDGFFYLFFFFVNLKTSTTILQAFRIFYLCKKKTAKKKQSRKFIDKNLEKSEKNHAQAQNIRIALEGFARARRRRQRRRSDHNDHNDDDDDGGDTFAACNLPAEWLGHICSEANEAATGCVCRESTAAASVGESSLPLPLSLSHSG